MRGQVEAGKTEGEKRGKARVLLRPEKREIVAAGGSTAVFLR